MAFDSITREPGSGRAVWEAGWEGWEGAEGAALGRSVWPGSHGDFGSRRGDSPAPRSDLGWDADVAGPLVAPVDGGRSGAAGAAHCDAPLGPPVEERLERIAAAGGPLRRVLAAVAERLVATRAYERLDYARLADYARERPGVSKRQLQELARVHRALAGLPALERALVGNELPWSKVRLVARVATAEDEAEWIARASRISTRQLEEAVRRQAPPRDAADCADDDEPRTRLSVRCTSAAGATWAWVREMAERTDGRRLARGEALELVVAEVFSSVSLDPAFAERLDEPEPGRCVAAGGRGAPDGVAARSDPARDGSAVGDADALERERWDGPPSRRAPARELPRAVVELAAGLEEADAFELDRRLRAAVRLEQTLDAAAAPLLRIARCAEFEWRERYRPLEVYARDELGMSSSKARALLRLERAGDVCPELRAAYRAGRISWVKAQCLLPLLLLDVPGEWRPAWVAWAGRVTLRRLEADVERALLLRVIVSGRCWHDRLDHPERVREPVPEAERQVCAPGVDLEATEELVFQVPRTVALLFTAVRETLRVRLRSAAVRPGASGPGPGFHGPPPAPDGDPPPWPSDGEIFETMLALALRSWTLREPGARKPDPVIERDQYRCAVPGCTSRMSLHDHHVVFRSAGGSDAPENRITLCAFHHQRGVHARRLRITGRAPDALVFELGRRPGAPPLARYRSGDVAMGA